VRQHLRLFAATAAALLAAFAACAAHDAASWRSALAEGDAHFAAKPRSAKWDARTLLPGDPVGALLGLEDAVELRRAVQAFVVAEQAGRGFDNGAARSQARARAAGALADVAASRDAVVASQASDLLGVLSATGEAAGGTNDIEGAQAAFDASVRGNLRNGAAKANLEILLRRSRIVSARDAPGRGVAQRGGAGASTSRAGDGY
jgi:hypothetical protein